MHVVDAEGALVASNAPEADRARFMRGADANDLPQGVWYLGANATPPVGTQRPPALARGFIEEMRPLLVGLPEGGMASVETDAAAAFYGTLWVTLRVDGLVFAP